jgi:CheY-like chemotaxis protein
MQDGDASGRVLLVVEDDKDICDVIEQVFRSRGCTVLVAHTGREGLDFLRTSSVLPNAILLDLMMPEMDGLQFLKVIEEEHVGAHIPVAVTTGSGRCGPRDLPPGVSAWLFKPIDHDQLVSVVMAMLA